MYAVAISLAYDFLSDFDDGSSDELINLLAYHINVLPTQLSQIKKKVLLTIEFQCFLSEDQYVRKLRAVYKNSKNQPSIVKKSIVDEESKNE